MVCGICGEPGHYRTTCPKANMPGYKAGNKAKTKAAARKRAATKHQKQKAAKQARTDAVRTPSAVAVICPPVVFADKSMASTDEGRARLMLESCVAPADIKAVQVHAKTAARVDYDDVLYSIYLFDDEDDMSAHAEDKPDDSANPKTDIPLAILLSRLARTKDTSTATDTNLGKFPKCSAPGYIMRASWGNSGTYVPPSTDTPGQSITIHING